MKKAADFSMMTRAVMAGVVCGMAAALCLRTVWAHGDAPHPLTRAELLAPRGIELATGDRYLFHWTDGDAADASIDFFFTNRNPPTFVPGKPPAELTGLTIASGIPVKDTTNQLAWDVSAVPSGAYWIWSRVDDPEVSASKDKSIVFSPGIVVVSHPGEALAPAVVLLPPSEPYRWPAANAIEIEYSAFDPDGTAEVRVEARRAADPSPAMMIIADHLPASKADTFVWDTTALAEGEWSLRAIISDRRGYSFTAYDQYFRFVNHADPAAETAGGCSDVQQAVTSGRLRSVVNAAVMVLGALLILVLVRWVLRTQRKPGIPDENL